MSLSCTSGERSRSASSSSGVGHCVPVYHLRVRQPLSSGINGTRNALFSSSVTSLRSASNSSSRQRGSSRSVSASALASRAVGDHLSVSVQPSAKTVAAAANNANRTSRPVERPLLGLLAVAAWAVTGPARYMSRNRSAASAQTLLFRSPRTTPRERAVPAPIPNPPTSSFPRFGSGRPGMLASVVA